MSRLGMDPVKVAKIQALRRAGFSFAEIADALAVPKSTVIYHSSSIPVRRDGHNEILRTLADLAAALEPGRLFQEPPLPNVIIAKFKRLQEIMAGAVNLE
jgi:hypothetical protein